ncbi:MAG: Fe2+-dependent dioxygenase [Gammaproteobacteria bacterium]|nr:Fe2+-dependent dioxygenase [Gammaproteobacteria bacterium]
MILAVDNVLNSDETNFLLGLFDATESHHGAATAQGDVKELKHNKQLLLGERAPEVRQCVLEALNRHPHLSYALLPKTVSMPALSVYEPGMAYGPHTDAHLGQHGGAFFRCDISCTIFLSDPASYDGGALTIRTPEGAKDYKLAAGSAVFYPTTYIHLVNEVTAGERKACIMWFESFVRDHMQRWMLYELQQIRAWMDTNQPITSEPRQRLVNFCENLNRMWVET